jgi:uncharacterized membrane protein YphA (DoxX/SURF4 family)
VATVRQTRVGRDFARRNDTKFRAIGYWLSTGLLAFALLSGGAAELARRPENVEGMARLGYPVYFMSIIGFWKVLGGLVLLAPRLPRLKEWAYAGIFFNMTGAAISHAVSGDAAWHTVVTATFAVLTIASWALRPASRTLGRLDSGDAVRREPVVKGAESIAHPQADLLRA